MLILLFTLLPGSGAALAAAAYGRHDPFSTGLMAAGIGFMLGAVLTLLIAAVSK
jgi:hypothetical protein